MTRPTQVPLERPARCRVRDCHPLWSAVPSGSTIDWFCNSHVRSPTTPQRKPSRFRLFRFRSPLLTESHSLSFPPVTEMFHFTGCRDVSAMYSQKLDQVLTRSGYPIRKCTGQSVFAAIRALSQLITSFFAYWHQGIHHVLFVA